MPSVLDLFSLHGQTALITGATRGIGQVLAIALADAGADLILVRRDTSNQATKDAVEALGRKATIYVADLASPFQVGSLAKRILADGHAIDILVNCGGIQTQRISFQMMTGTKDVGAYMLTREPSAATSTGTVHRGSIINIASLVPFQGGLNVPAYASAKGGVAQLTKSLSNQCAARGINVNAIAPVYIHTNMNEALIKDEKRAASILERIPADGWGLPEDFKGAIEFLASRASLYVSGGILTVDGGWTSR